MQWKPLAQSRSVRQTGSGSVGAFQGVTTGAPASSALGAVGSGAP